MKTSDLTNNKTRIIRAIRYQGAEVKETMVEMVKGLKEDVKPTMKNIDALARQSLVFADSTRTMEEINEESRISQRPSSLR